MRGKELRDSCHRRDGIGWSRLEPSFCDKNPSISSKCVIKNERWWLNGAGKEKWGHSGIPVAREVAPSARNTATGSTSLRRNSTPTSTVHCFVWIFRIYLSSFFLLCFIFLFVFFFFYNISNYNIWLMIIFYYQIKISLNYFLSS